MEGYGQDLTLHEESETIIKRYLSREPYPKRNIAEKNYQEEPDISTDECIYCDICMQEFANGCKVHKLIRVRDERIPISLHLEDRARLTVPQGWLKVSSSKIENCGEGIWSLKFIPAGVQFGPYEGQLITKIEDSKYCWRIKVNREVRYLDGKDKRISNWMRYVNCARNNQEQNLIAYQYRGAIYYRTIKHIPAETELLVFYGSEYARELGVDVTNYYSSTNKPLREKFFKCSNCYLIFKSRINLEEHLERCSYQSISRNTMAEENTIFQTTSGNSPENTYKCVYCTLSFATNNSYENHIEEAHSISQYLALKTNTIKQTRKNECPYCGTRFSAPYFLNRHLPVHTRDKPFKCNKCNWGFTRLYDLNKHNLKHEYNDVYMCEFCSESFVKYSNLLLHKRTHQDNKPHTCDICSKSFKRLDVLNKHKYIHVEYLK